MNEDHEEPTEHTMTHKETLGQVGRWMTRMLALSAGRLRWVFVWAWRNLVALWRSRLLQRLRRPAWRAGRAAALGLGGALCLWLAGVFLFERVAPGNVAVEQINWGADAGIVDRDYGPGLHLSLGGRSTWHRLPAGTQFINFGWDNIGGTQPMLAVAIQGGVPAQVSITVPYRIQPGSAWQIVQSGLKGDYGSRVTAIARRVLLEELGQLSTDDLANTDTRSRAAQAALTRLNADLATVHLEALDVVIGPVYFDPSFEKKLHEKQLATQTQLTNQSLAARKAAELNREFSLHEMAAEQKAVAAEWDMKIEQARVALERELEQLRRETQEYSDSREAESELRFTERVAAGARVLSNARAVADAARSGVTQDPAEPLLLARGEAEQSLKAAQQAFFQGTAAINDELKERTQLERLAHQEALAVLKREIEATTSAGKADADAEYKRQVAQGKLALVEAAALADGLHNQVLEGAGGRLYLAREAARNLRIDKVVLDSGDPRVPSILDLDELLAMLIGQRP